MRATGPIEDVEISLDGITLHTVPMPANMVEMAQARARDRGTTPRAELSEIYRTMLAAAECCSNGMAGREPPSPRRV